MWASAMNMVHFLTDVAQHTPCSSYPFLFSLQQKCITWIKRERNPKRIEYPIINHCMMGAQNASLCWEHESFLWLVGVWCAYHVLFSLQQHLWTWNQKKNSEKNRISHNNCWCNMFVCIVVIRFTPFLISNAY